MSVPSKRQVTVTLDNQQLTCKNKCGFFGNPQWSGFCSKCHRELNQKHKDEHPTKRIQRSHSDAHESEYHKFAKFHEKKKQHVEKRAKTLSRIIKKKPKESSNQSPSREFPVLEEYFSDQSLKDAVLKDIVKQIQYQLEIMHKYAEKSIDEQSETMQDFYNFMFNRCETHSDYSDLTCDQIDALMDKIEHQLMNTLYRTVNQQILFEYEEKDLALQSRIRSLNWITAEHLGLNIKENSPQIRELMDKAIANVLSMDSNIPPQEKIKVIVNCSNSIINIINLSQGVTASADEFLPAMVYIVLKANPPLLQSNIKYITSYSIPTRLRSGEGAYYFTNLCCAVAFIEDLTAESLSMTEDEFQRYMSGIVPLSVVEQSSDCEGLRLMTRNLITLTEMVEKGDRNNEIQDLMDNFAKLTETIRKCKPTSPLKINATPYTIPSNTDMSLVPEALRNRVQKAPTEDILVEIDVKPESNSQQASIQNDHTQPSESSNLALVQSLQVILPSNSDIPKEVGMEPHVTNYSQTHMRSATQIEMYRQTADPLPINYIQSAIEPQITSLTQTAIRPEPQIGMYNQKGNPLITNCTQSVIDIKDLNYPTEMFTDDPKSEEDGDFGPFESCDLVPEILDFASSSANPLSPETGYIEQKFNLPPPLLPLVVQSKNVDDASESLL